jgi:proteasome lid subunit RPN8/RPN11
MKMNQNPPNPNPPNPSSPTPKLRKFIRPRDPVLRFAPSAWAKLLFFRDHGETEIGGFALTDPEDLLYVRDFLTVKQEVTMASVAFQDEAVADFFEMQVDAGRQPEQFARIWLHSHPGNSPQPSGTDEATFHRVFGKCDWAVMFIVAQDSKTYARLRFNLGPGGYILIPVQMDYRRPFGPSDQAAWQAEYQAHILTEACTLPPRPQKPSLIEDDPRDYALPSDIVEQLEWMEPAERRAVLAELAGRPDLWSDEVEVDS